MFSSAETKMKKKRGSSYCTEIGFCAGVHENERVRETEQFCWILHGKVLWLREGREEIIYSLYWWTLDMDM